MSYIFAVPNSKNNLFFCQVSERGWGYSASIPSYTLESCLPFLYSQSLGEQFISVLKKPSYPAAVLGSEGHLVAWVSRPWSFQYGCDMQKQERFQLKIVMLRNILKIYWPSGNYSEASLLFIKKALFSAKNNTLGFCLG